MSSPDPPPQASHEMSGASNAPLMPSLPSEEPATPSDKMALYKEIHAHLSALLQWSEDSKSHTNGLGLFTYVLAFAQGAHRHPESNTWKPTNSEEKAWVDNTLDAAEQTARREYFRKQRGAKELASLVRDMAIAALEELEELREMREAKELLRDFKNLRVAARKKTMIFKIRDLAGGTMEWLCNDRMRP